jgi:acyl-CoA synthetase (AMP-forming)/AMP-acid ligase II
MSAVPESSAATAAPPFRAIADLVREHAAARPDQRALVQGGRSLTWGELDRMADRIAASLQRDGVLPQERIAICGANSIEYAAIFIGGLRAGAAVAPLPTGSQPAQLAGMLADSGARHFFVDAGVPPLDGAVQRIAMDGSAPPALVEHWLLPSGVRPLPVTVQPIYPSDLEAVLRRHPGVADAAVVGVPSAEWGETPVAFIVPGPSAPPEGELRAWANEQLGKTQRVADVRYMAELPRSDIGKVFKREVREQYAAKG